ncbi:MAG TPA: glycoside hydrolase family 3 protein, partial [bacterium]|nr:glycoside hydrolase family 3 protein [bacterium]
LLPLIEGTTVLPGNMAVGSVGDEDCAYAAGRVTATELHLLGINVNFAPVVDISNNPDNPSTGVRSFGGDPDKVARLGAATIKGLQEHGMIACAKHFPGKGDVSVDSHLDLPLNASSRGALAKRELVPFRAAVEAGAGMIMTAHVMYPEVAENKILPATLSKNVMTDLLRGELKFKGVAITDDLEMGAIEKYFTVEETVERAVLAGADLVMFCHTPAKQKKAIDALRRAVESGRIPPQRIDESVGRISRLKQKISTRREDIAAALESVPYHHLIADRIARDSITIVRNEQGILPLYLRHDQRLLMIAPKYEVLTQVEEKEGEEEMILDLLRIRHEKTSLARIDTEPGEKDFEVLSTVKEFHRVILLTYNAHLTVKQLLFAKKLIAARPDAVIVAVRNPYDLSKLADAQTTVATYGYRNCSLKALVEVLFGEIEAKGVMPVKL